MFIDSLVPIEVFLGGVFGGPGVVLEMGIGVGMSECLVGVVGGGPRMSFLYGFPWTIERIVGVVVEIGGVVVEVVWNVS